MNDPVAWPEVSSWTGCMLRWAAAALCCGLILAGVAACGSSRPENGGAAPPAGRVELSYRLDGPRTDRVRVRAGAVLVITLRETPGYAWTAVESLSPPVVSVVRSGHGATVMAEARAVAAGEAELRWMSSFTGDRFGPPTLLWRLIVTVVP